MRLFSESGEASEHHEVNSETTFKEVPLLKEALHKEVPSSPESSTLKDITKRLRSFEGNLEAESSEIDDLKKNQSRCYHGAKQQIAFGTSCTTGKSRPKNPVTIPFSSSDRKLPRHLIEPKLS